MFRRIFITLKNKKNQHIQQNILFLANKLCGNINIKRLEQNLYKEKDNNILFKDNKEPNNTDYPVKILRL